jgi:hypothetical protein
MFNYTPIKPILVLTLGLLFLSGCQTITLNNTVPVTAVPSNEPDKDESELLAQLATSLSIQPSTMNDSQMDEADEFYEPVSNSFSPTRHHVRLDSYVEQMAIELSDLIHEQSHVEYDIGVASFVSLGASLEQSNQLGNQLSEIFIHHLHRFGYSVVEFKAMDTIKVTPRGDFILSRNVSDIQGKKNLPTCVVRHLDLS